MKCSSIRKTCLITRGIYFFFYKFENNTPNQLDR